MKSSTESTKKSNILASSFLKKTLSFLTQNEIREEVQEKIIDPLIQHIMKQVFPYIILTCVLFVLLLIVVLLTLGIIVFQFSSGSVLSKEL